MADGTLYTAHHRGMPHTTDQTAQTMQLVENGLKALASDTNTQLGRYALTQFTEAIQLMPSNALPYALRSKVRLQLGRHEQALSDAKKVVELDPMWTRGYYLTGVAMVELRQFEAAIDVLKTGLRFSHKSEPLLAALKDAETKLGLKIHPKVYHPHEPAPKCHPLYDNGKGSKPKGSTIGARLEYDPPSWPDDGTPYHSQRNRQWRKPSKKSQTRSASPTGDDADLEPAQLNSDTTTTLNKHDFAMERRRVVFRGNAETIRPEGHCPPSTPKEEDVQVRGQNGLLPLSTDGQPTVVNLVEELWTSKEKIIELYTSRKFYRDLKKVIKYATRTLLTLPVAMKDVVVFDVDDTVLDSFPAMQELDFGQIPKLMPDYIEKANGPALPHVHALYSKLLERGYEVVFITSRSEAFREATELNLKKVGYDKFSKLIMRQPDELLWTVYKYKSTARRKLVELEGFNVVACLGDQWADITGEHAGLGVKVPNLLSYFC